MQFLHWKNSFTKIYLGVLLFCFGFDSCLFFLGYSLVTVFSHYLQHPVNPLNTPFHVNINSILLCIFEHRIKWFCCIELHQICTTVWLICKSSTGHVVFCGIDRKASLMHVNAVPCSFTVHSLHYRKPCVSDEVNEVVQPDLILSNH